MASSGYKSVTSTISYLLPTIATFWTVWYTDYTQWEGPVDDVQEVLQEYDYVVIGGGSAGSVIAARLSENPSVTVLLIEAGGQETDESEVPGLAAYLQLSDMDWQYKSEPSSTSCLGMLSNRCNLPRGKVLGGSSSINYMIYVRGNRKDYDIWEELGNYGWGYESVFPYFLKLEDNTNFTLTQEGDGPVFHSTGGPITISDLTWQTSLATSFLEAGREIGYSVVDINGPSQSGFMSPQGFVRKGARCSNAKAYLRPANHRENLHISLHTMATKIAFDKNRRVSHVQYIKGKASETTVRALREVILSAGAINTPQLLMLSGIGPGNQLEANGIPVIRNAPVGQNLQDHIAAPVLFTIDSPVSMYYRRLQNLPSSMRYVFFGSGPLTTLGGVEGVAFVNTKFANISNDYPDIEFHFVSGTHASDEGDQLRYAFGLKDELYKEYFKPLEKIDSFTMICKLLKPHSKGFIELRSADPFDYPKIHTNYLTNSFDVYTLIEGMKIAMQVGKTKAFKKFGTNVYGKVLPGCESQSFGSDSYLECVARYLSATIYHYSGTAKMGPLDDPEAVVDPELKVYGVHGLRVVDASIFPIIPMEIQMLQLPW